MSPADLTGRAAIVTGAGGGLGRAEALRLAAEGAGVVVNDVGPSAHAVTAEIRAAGGDALAVPGDVGDWSFGGRLVEAALRAFGRLDIVVNNAGVTRDKMLFNLSESDWDEVVRVHLKGHAALSRAAAAHWREQGKRSGRPVYGRIINTSSEAFLLGGPGQANYAAAKAGITALTLSTARALGPYGVTANAICPRARTGMTAHAFGDGAPDAHGGLDLLAPERVAVFVAYLASSAAQSVSGQVFIVYSDFVALMAAPAVEHVFTAADGAFTVAELAGELGPYFEGRPPGKTFGATSVAALDNTGNGNVGASSS